MSPFSPQGDRSRRVAVAERAAKAQPGDILTFADLARELGLDESAEDVRSLVRQAVSAARTSLLRDHHRALVAVRGTGYRVALPGEYAGLAEDHRERAHRQVSKALAVIEHAPEDEMSPAELQRFRAVGVVVRNLSQRMTSMEQRMADMEDVMQSLLYGGKPKTIPGSVEES